MSANIESLVVELKADIAGLQTSLRAAASSVGGFRDKATGDVDQFQKAIDRARNAIISMGGAWFAFRTGRAIVDAAVQMQALNAKMQAATASTVVAADSMKYARDLAERLGLSFVTTADGFASFAASALRAGLTLDQTKDIFTGVSEAATGMRLSAERVQWVFMAVQQMASKGTVQMQELKQQLGESLPGAIQVFAKAMGKENDEFINLIENGKVTTADLIKLGKGLRDEFGASAEQAARGAQAAFNRLGNAWFDLKLKMAENGFLDAITDAAVRLTDKLNDPSIQDGLKSFATLLGEIASAAVSAAAAIGHVFEAAKTRHEAVKELSGQGKILPLSMLPLSPAALLQRSYIFNSGVSAKMEEIRARQAASGLSYGGALDQVPVDGKYTLGKLSTPSDSESLKRVTEMRKKLRDQVKDMKAGLITEGDPNKADSAEAMASLNKRYEEEHDLLQKALQKKAITEQEYRDASLKTELDYQARLAEIRMQYRDQFLSDEQAFAEGFLGVQLDMQNRSLSDQGKSFRETISQAAQHNRAFFALEKAAALARALISARQTVVDAYRWGTQFGGPPGGAIAAGIAAAAQAVNIAAIASTSYGGSSGGGGGGDVGSADGGGGTSGSSSQSTTPRQNTIYVYGKDRWYDKNDLRQFVEDLNDLAPDGTKLVFA